jgi:hypothetical protein
MMFIKTAFALYFAALVLAAPKRDLVNLGDIGTSHMNPCPL